LNILALDLSLAATGVALPDGTLYTEKPSTKGDRRLCEIARAIGQQLNTRDIDLVVLEDLPMGIRNAAAGALGMLHGAVRYKLIRLDVPYLLVPPATLKVFATGRGNATKADMRLELYKRTGLDIRDDNQVDAWWLRALALDLAGHPILELPQTHRRALDKLTLPVLEVTA
jgi:Holliday junction resolvasome RuvABC endonuclease subunit